MKGDIRTAQKGEKAVNMVKVQVRVSPQFIFVKLPIIYQLRGET